MVELNKGSLLSEELIDFLLPKKTNREKATKLKLKFFWILTRESDPHQCKRKLKWGFQGFTSTRSRN